MKRVLAVFGGLSIIALLSIFLFWYWLTPHKHEMIRRAEKGDVQAMYDVGIAHLSVSGKGVVDPTLDRNPIYWFRLAATNGHAGAMYILADLGIPNEEKVMWLKKGAALGSEACVIELMNGYRFGKLGLPKDTGAAIFWELKRGELYLKRDKKSPEETRALLAQWEQRYRKENHYDGPIRPLP